MGTTPSEFYTGLVAQLYGPLRSAAPDPEPYARFVARSGEPALELGCGDGDPLLALRRRGLDVEGLDSSADMLERCRAAAAREKLDVVVHHQTMETMDLPRRYRTIYLAGPTLNLLPDDDVTRRALERIEAHLEPRGSALIPLFVPEATPPDRLGVARERVSEDGTVMRFTALSEVRDEQARQQITMTRYESISAGATVTEERPWLLHWHTQAGFRRLCTDAGLMVTAVLAPGGGRAGPDDDTVVFWVGTTRS